MSVETYDCRHCGARMGIAGDFSSDDDYDTQAYFDEEVARHESGACVATAPIEVVPTLDPRAGFISGLQELAELLEWTPDLPLPSKIGTDGEVAWNVWPSMVDDVTAEVARIRRLLPPALWTKNDPTAGEYGAKYYELSAPLHGLTLTICTRCLRRRSAACACPTSYGKPLRRKPTSAATTCRPSSARSSCGTSGGSDYFGSP
jgi:hypothetical protein